MPLFLCSGSLDREIDRARRVGCGAARRRGRHPRLESLEIRITPSTWTGAGGNGNWSNGANWSGGAPGAGASLIFPAGVAHLNAVNDLPAGTQFSSIEIDGSGYALSGNAIVLSQGISTTYSSGTSSDAINTQLGGAVSVGAGGELDLNGALTGASGLTVSGGGTLGLGGSGSNTYNGATVVNGKTLLTLNKSGGAIAVPGDLTIGDGTNAATARETASAQIATNSNVTVNDKSTLDLDGQNNTIGTLSLTGAAVTTGAGTLTLNGDITANDAATEDVSSISGKLDLGGVARVITVAEPTTDTTPDTDLTISAVISDSTTGLTVTGGGTLDLSGTNTYTGLTTILGTGTTLLVDGTVGAVRVGPGTTLGGSGTVGDVDVVAGTVTPGDGNGPLKTGSLALDGSSTFAPQLIGPASVAFGRLSASGAVTLDGTLAATLGGSYNPVRGDKLTIISNNSGSGVTGTFTGLPEGGTVTIAGFPFQITYQGGSGHDVVLTALGRPTSTTITTSTQSSTYGQSLILTASVGGLSFTSPGGAVSFYDGTPTPADLLGSGPVNNQGQVIFSTRALKVTGSPHQIYAVFSGSTIYADSTTAQPASVIITPATVTAQLTGTVSKPYDGTTDATLTAANYQLSGVIGNDVVGLNTVTTGTYDTKAVGTNKTVTVSGLSITGADSSNYTLSSDTASGPVGIITAKPLTVTGITADNKVYDGTTSATIHVGEATLSGVLPGETVNLETGGATGAFSDKHAGIGKTVIVSGLSLSGTNAGNYSIGPVNGVSANINPAPLTVTANAATMTYGGTVPNLTYSVTGLVPSDTQSTALAGALATTATSKSHVDNNPYPITQGTLATVSGDYTITFHGADLTVTQAPLTITANDATKVYGAPLPSFPVSYSGFKNGDTAANLTTPPSPTTPATSTSPVGSYSINVAGATSGDYSITFVPGKLTVTQASTASGLSGGVSTTVVGQTVAYSVQVAPVSPGAGQPTGTVILLADGRPVATATVDPATGRASLSTSSLGRGSHTITASYSGDTNFVSSQAGSVQATVSAAGTQSLLTAQAVRNKRGKITKVELLSQVLVVSPGGGVPTGVVTYFRKGRRIRTVALSDGRAELRLKANQALRKRFTVRYGSDGNYNASASSPVVPTKKSLKTLARPLIGFLGRG